MSLVECANAISVERVGERTTDTLELPVDLAIVVASGWCVPSAMSEPKDAVSELKELRFDPENFGSIMHEELEASLGLLAQFYDCEQDVIDACRHHKNVWINAYNSLTKKYAVYTAESVLAALLEDKRRINVNYIIRLREMFPLHTDGFNRYNAHATRQISK